MVLAKVLEVRLWIAACALGAAGWMGISCASAEDETDFGGLRDASSDRVVGFGGAGGSGFGGSGGSGFGGGSGAGFGGSSGAGFGGTAGAGTGGAGGGTCNPSFCPNSGTGQPCCMGPDGPCGIDMNGVCQAQPSQDF